MSSGQRQPSHHELEVVRFQGGRVPKAGSRLVVACPAESWRTAMGHKYPSPEEFAYFEKAIEQREPAS
jgi:hypothetical protein